MKLLLTHYPFAAQIMAMLFVAMPIFAANDQCEEPPYPDQFPFKECAVAEPLSWDWDNTDMEIGASSEGTVSVSGGSGPYTWTISGSGFFLDSGHTLKTITTTQASVTIFTDGACGPADVTVIDGCEKTKQEIVRSSEGRWNRLGSWRTRDYIANLHADIYKCVTNMYGWQTSILTTQYKGKYAITTDYRGPEYKEDATYRGGMHPWCATSDIEAITYYDPIVGVFEIPGTTGGNHYIDPNVHDGVPGYYRIGYYLSPGVNTELQIFEYSCQ